MSRTDFRRKPERGHHDPDTIHAVLDSEFVAHVGFLRQGLPAVLPMLYVRRGDEILLHGNPASPLMRSAKRGDQVCVSVAKVDGVVLARSAFNHSVNYRSVVVYGAARWITGADRVEALDILVDRLVPDRRPHVRPMTRNEIAGTAVVGVSLDQASAKIRTGPPIDDEADYELPIWAGVVPLRSVTGEPIPDPRNHPGTEVPEHVTSLGW